MWRTTFTIWLLLIVAPVANAQTTVARASITLVSPTFGAPGTTVTIRGVGFSSDPQSGYQPQSPWVKELASEPPPGAVAFNGVPGEILFLEDDLITVKVPTGATTGPVRVILPNVKLVLTGDVFEVYYSSPTGAPSELSESPAADTPQAAGVHPRTELTEQPRPLFGEENPPAAPFFFSGAGFYPLSLGERAFLREEHVPRAFLFGVRHPLVLADHVFFPLGFFAQPNFDRLSVQELLFLELLHRRSARTSVRPFFNRNRSSRR